MEIIKDIESRTPEYLEENIKKYIGDFPNTYTYSKNLTERAMLQK